MHGYTEREIERFWSKVDVRGPDDCWLWTACRNAHGYGRIGIGGRAGRTILAHRMSLEIKLDRRLSDDEVSAHSCDTTSCQNPSHLFETTQVGNLADMTAKGRRALIVTSFGENHPMSKLSTDLVIDIRMRYAIESISQRNLARYYGVSQPTIGRIIRREAWSHVR